MLGLFKRSKERTQLPVTTDIHCHIVPGVDDGSPNVETSVELVEGMRSFGFERIFASPHVTDTSFENTPDLLDPALADLNAALAKKGDGFQVDRHAEYRLDDFFSEQLAKGLVTTLPQDFILVENSFMQEPWDLEQIVFDLKIKGFRPILAHPERYEYYAVRNRARYHELHAAGLLFQINLLSLANHYGGYERETAEWLIERNLVDFIGTDIHRQRHIESIDQYLRTSRARKHFTALKGKLLNDTL